MSRSAKTLVMVPVLSFVLIFVAGYTLYWASGFTRQSEQAFNQSSGLAQIFVAPMLSAAVWDFDEGRAETALAGLGEMSSFVFAEVRSDGDTFAQVSRAEEWNPDFTTAIDEVVQSAEAGGEAALSPDLQARLPALTVVPVDLVLEDGKAVGTLYMGLSRSELEQTIQAIMMRSVAIATMAFLALAGLIYVVTGSLTTPLNRVAEMIDKITGGDLDFDVTDTHRRDEVGRIAQAVEVFRKNSAEIRHLQEREQQSRRDAEDARKQMMGALQSAIGDVVEKARNGDFSGRVNSELEEPELAALARAVSEIVIQVDEGLHAISAMLHALAEGKLTTEIAGPNVGMFASLQTDAKATAERLRVMVQKIEMASEEIMGSSESLSGDAGRLSQRTQVLAAAMEETSATMEALSEKTRMNSETAAQSKEQAEAAKDVANEGTSVASLALEKMRDIQNGSNRIREVTTVVEGIAFQTNLLALNASVEAARAGSAGAGFAVVAQEVRALSERVASASSEINDLVSTNVGEVVEGVELVQKTHSSLETILERISQLDDAAEAIHASSTDQASNISQLSSTVTSIDHQTQENSQSVESSSRETASIMSTAQNLRELTKFFDTSETAPDPAVKLVS